MKLDVYKIDGSKTGEKIELKPAVFGIEPNDHAIWQAVVTEMTNRRQGNASTKNRSAVRGGGRKPWRQKGRGTARAGTIRSPLWRGGGRIFGPQPKDYHIKINKKVKRLARKSALTYKAREEKIKLIEDFSFDAPKTKSMAEIMNKLKLDSVKTLILLAARDQNIYLSSRNIPDLSVKGAGEFSTYDVLDSDVVIIQKSALDIIYEVLSK